MLTADERNLFKLINELSPGVRAKAIRQALNRKSKEVRLKAVENMRTAKGGKKGVFEPGEGMEKQVRRVIMKKKIGFTVTIGSNKGKNRPAFVYKSNGKKKRVGGPPVIIFAEGGTKARRTKTATKIWTRSRKGHATGQMPRFGFMEKTKKEMDKCVTEDLKNMIIDNIKKTAIKYGCKVT